MPDGAATILVPRADGPPTVHRVPATAHGDRGRRLPTSLGERQQDGIAIDECGRHPHTPVGTLRSAWMSAQLCPIGSTLPGFARHAGSNARRRRS